MLLQIAGVVFGLSTWLFKVSIALTGVVSISSFLVDMLLQAVICYVCWTVGEQ
jgi:hypothetical protein